ncbi:MAG: Gfo/Idh/MocA family oxidoreductase [Alistipes sp.]
MKRLIIPLLLLATLFFVTAYSKSAPKKGYQIEDGRIIFDTPVAAAGQVSMVGFAAAPMPVVRVGFIGLGMRGPGAVERFTHLEGVEIKALCDLYPERVEATQAILEKRGLPRADMYSGEEGWKALCERKDLDLIYIVTPWQLHTPMAVYAMEQGKHVAVEVPAATSLEECWALVNTAEKTQRHCMMLENCVYDFFELTTLNMAQHGLFGEILHAEGAYIHNLEPFWDEYQGNWRLDFNQKHRGDVYATHGLGPACQALDIHRGDRMTYLVAMDTKSVNGAKIAKKKMGVETFANADLTTTLISTERGKTIELQHDVYTPRPYSRMYQLTGTEGFANKYPIEGYVVKKDKVENTKALDIEDFSEHDFVPEGVKAMLMKEYEDPIQIELAEKAKEVGGHGGMDFIMDYRLIYCLHHGLPLDQDVYDAAEWSCIGALTAASLAHHSLPVAVPDFTRGNWNKTQGYRHAMKK